ncbi:hypothetical protein LZ24_01027 [Desulfobotulus alkaliphilus]|uniref:Uncharacterized protein n=1 Tax=Desulfobotulus alkaliphilus TaxID=622671 RepID=A0A562RZ50_9BACT|nr:hypothetical protein [Desulfobotulus alkaliphilus]TWI74421.1 hypothetical protein LZ24_01027 [Desulfobotulus alkaliphilus]
MESKTDKNGLHLWVRQDLEKKDSVLKKLAGFLLKDSRKWGSRFDDPFVQDIDEMLSILVAEVLEAPSRYGAALQMPHPLPWFKKVFQNRMQDRERSLDVNPSAYFRKKLFENLSPPEIHSFAWGQGKRKTPCYRNTPPDYAPLHLPYFFIQDKHLPANLADISGREWGKRNYQVSAALYFWDLIAAEENRVDFSIEKESLLLWLREKSHLKTVYDKKTGISLDEDDEVKHRKVEEATGAFPDMEYLLDAKNSLQSLPFFREAVKKLLPPEGLQLLDGLNEGKSQGDIARQIGCSEPALTQLKKKCFRILKEHFSKKEMALLLADMKSRPKEEDFHE